MAWVLDQLEKQDLSFCRSRRPRNQHKRGALKSFAAVSEETLSSPEIDETSVCAEAKDQLKNILMAAVDLLQLHYPA